MKRSNSSQCYAVVLGVLALLFLGRVLGQLLVATGYGGKLPPMDQWYSGLIPYPVLLPIQAVILALQAKVGLNLWRGSGAFARRSRRWGYGLGWFSLLYFLVMLGRHVLTIALVAARPWWDGAIPIVFHWILPAYLFVLSRYHLAEDAVDSSS